jgi:PAS domain S-box-containing protein
MNNGENSRGSDKTQLLPAQFENMVSILDQVSDGIYITDRERLILYWNRAAEAITGFSQDEVLGKRCADNILVHTDMAGKRLCGSDLCPLYRAMESGFASKLPLTVKARHKNGERVVVEVSVSPLRDSSNKVVGGIEIFRNVSERVSLEEQKARFFSALNHELKTPLANMHGYLSMLLNRDAGELSETQEEFIATIAGEEQKLTGMIEEMLEMGRFESTDFSYENSLFDISSVLSSIVNSFKAGINEELHLVLDIAPDLMIIGDRERLGQAFSNLLSNALKYSEKGTVKLSAEQKLETGEIVVSIADQGIGIPEKEQEAIFEMFYRVENPGTRSKGGAGVGLYIVKRIIERHEGRLTLTSKPGKGSTFTVSLPGAFDIK